MTVAFGGQGSSKVLRPLFKNANRSVWALLLVASPQSVRRTTDRRDEFLIVRRGLTPRRIERRTESLRCSMQGRDFLPLITGNEVRQREYTLVAALEATTGIFLLYADAPMSEADPPARSDLLLRCESHPNNKSALTRVIQLSETAKLFMPLILGSDGTVIWSGPELL